MSNVQVLIVSQSLLVPLLLSIALYYISASSTGFQVTTTFLAWFVVYIWIRGGIPLFPKEALDWLWVITLLITLSSLYRTRGGQALLCLIVFVGGLIAYSWPVLNEEFSLLIAAEIIFFSAIALLLLHRVTASQLTMPALSMTISLFSLAIVIGLEGSLLMAQLASALAGMLGVFVYFEVMSKGSKVSLNIFQWRILISIYLGYLFVSRIYVELHIVPTMLLLVSPILGLSRVAKYGWLSNLLIGGMAMLWVLLNGSQVGY